MKTLLNNQSKPVVQSQISVNFISSGARGSLEGSPSVSHRGDTGEGLGEVSCASQPKQKNNPGCDRDGGDLWLSVLLAPGQGRGFGICLHFLAQVLRWESQSQPNQIPIHQPNRDYLPLTSISCQLFPPVPLGFSKQSRSLWLWEMFGGSGLSVAPTGNLRSSGGLRLSQISGDPGRVPLLNLGGIGGISFSSLHWCPPENPPDLGATEKPPCPDPQNHLLRPQGLQIPGGRRTNHPHPPHVPPIQGWGPPSAAQV